MRFKAYVITLLIFLGFSAYGQDVTKRCKWIKTNTPVLLDSLSPVPGSLIISGSASAVEHEYDYNSGLVKVESQSDSALICYSVLPFSLSQKHYHRDLSVYDSGAYFKDPVSTEQESLLGREQLFETEGLNKSGSISRGISFGNNQDVFVNSTLNLNLDGKLTDDLFIRAAITDQNVPFQPEGNTQQLQDFDNVFIQLYNDNFSITGGDIVLKSEPSYFLKYYKNVQGGIAQVDYKIGDTEISNRVGISVAKGKFSTVVIEPIDGVLGPYQIPGPPGQSYVIVLANSEKVFLDGTQLERGYNYDYIIDYNSGEITFTNNVLITEFSRIRVDYEYSDQNYSRSILTASHYQKTGKLKLFVNAYSEKDNRNRPLLVDLSVDDKVLLSEAGDDPNKAVIPGVDSVEFSNERILYALRNSPNIEGQVYTYYEYSTDATEAFYQLTFSNVGIGNGNYIQATTTANGKVYQWVEPVAGVPQGTYEPVIQVPPPNKKQMINIGADYGINEYENISVEMASSTYDMNLFSTYDSNDDAGKAIRTTFSSKGRALKPLKNYKFEYFSSFEFDDKYFNPIDRIRYIEFDRDWGLDPSLTLSKQNDLIIATGVKFEKSYNQSFGYDISYRSRGSAVDGWQQKAFANQSLGKIRLRTAAFNLKNNQDSVKVNWQRFSTDVSFQTPYIVPGYRFTSDHNQISANDADSVVNSAMYYDEHAFYIKNGDSTQWQLNLEHAFREDKMPLEGKIEPYTYSNTSKLNVGRGWDNHNLDLMFVYRTLEYKQTGKLDETISGRLNLSNQLLNRHITSDLTYAISNSRELKREFIFIKVASGQGTHTWRDLNEDGVQDLGEFFEAINVDERNYAKIFTPTNEYVTAFQNLLTYRVTMEMPRKWRDAKGIKKVLGKLSNVSSWSANVKTTDDDLSTRVVGFLKDVNNDELLAQKSSVKSTIFFNRSNLKYGADFGFYNLRQKQLLINGFEARDNTEYSYNFRVNLSRQYSLRLGGTHGDKEVTSDYLEDRNYLIDYYTLSPELSWQPSGSFRITGKYQYQDKYNSQVNENRQYAKFNELSLDVKFNKAVTNSFNLQMRWVDIDFNGEENSALGYDILEALRPGQNVTWGLFWQQKIASGLQLNISYNGRKSEDSDIVHVGRVQVSALF